MGFRQNNETNRKWNIFYQANRELIAEIGLPGPTVDTWDRFADLLMHGIIDHHDDLTHFDLDELSSEKRKLFRGLVEKYFEAGFSDPGMSSHIVGGRKAFLKLARKYPQSFLGAYQKEAENVLSSGIEEWWLDCAALPDRFWARLTVYGDNSADVLDRDGNFHEFSSREEAEHWLAEEECVPLHDLIEAGDLPDTMAPPSAQSDAEIVLKMLERVERDF